MDDAQTVDMINQADQLLVDLAVREFKQEVKKSLGITDDRFFDDSFENDPLYEQYYGMLDRKTTEFIQSYKLAPYRNAGRSN